MRNTLRSRSTAHCELGQSNITPEAQVYILGPLRSWWWHHYRVRVRVSQASHSHGLDSNICNSTLCFQGKSSLAVRTRIRTQIQSECKIVCQFTHAAVREISCSRAQRVSLPSCLDNVLVFSFSHNCKGQKVLYENFWIFDYRWTERIICVVRKAGVHTNFNVLWSLPRATQTALGCWPLIAIDCINLTRPTNLQPVTASHIAHLSLKQPCLYFIDSWCLHTEDR